MKRVAFYGASVVDDDDDDGYTHSLFEFFGHLFVLVRADFAYVTN